jgi:Tfp pilus assembly protein PilW
MRSEHDDSGLSLAELVIVCTLVVVVASTSYMLLNSVTAMFDSTQAKAAASDSAQIAADAIARDLRQAQQNDPDYADGVFSVAQPAFAQFFVDTNHDGIPERVTYYTSGTVLYKVVAYPTGTAVPYSFGSTSTPTAVLSGLSAANATVFTYYSSTVDPSNPGTNGYAFQTVVTGDPLNFATKIPLVGVRLVNGATVGSQTSTITTTDLVRIRSINNGVN